MKSQWATLSRNDWGELLELSRKKAFQRKFQIVEAFIGLVAAKGLQHVTPALIAEKCGITRPLVKHHFPSEKDLILLSYRYAYARFQKRASDGLMAKSGITRQLRGYLDAVADWTHEHQDDARFLVQFAASRQLKLEYSKLYQRNVQIGQERIVALFMAAQAKEKLPPLTEKQLFRRVRLIQMLIAGILVGFSTNEDGKLTAADRDDLWAGTQAILGMRL